MEYRSKFTPDDGAICITFPDCPGCISQGDDMDDAIAMATEALELWLESHVMDGDVAPRPTAKRGVPIKVNPSLAVALQVRWMREDEGLTQAQLAKKLKVSQQSIAKLERPKGNHSIETLERLAKALGRHVNVTFEAA
jgi:predicted RNase H-like HicB family nuclease/DNA-binding XRE family transcriptional regulator